MKKKDNTKRNSLGQKPLPIDYYDLSEYSSSELATLSEFIESELNKRWKKSMGVK
tara:strand:+ start:470 stop:634 length:165 start_codon:yes stop_codon:yes gene_type:complete